MDKWLKAQIALPVQQITEYFELPDGQLVPDYFDEELTGWDGDTREDRYNRIKRFKNNQDVAAPLPYESKKNYMNRQQVENRISISDRTLMDE